MMSLLTSVARIAPSWLSEPAKGLWLAWRTEATRWAVTRYDRRQYRNSSCRPQHEASRVQLEARLTFHAHAIEKGLSHKVVRPHFGRVALTQLADALHEYRQLNLPRESLAYVNALSTVRAYAEAHRDLGVEPEILPVIFSPALLKEVESCPSRIGGVRTIARSEKQNNSSKNFADLFVGRASVREFADSSMVEQRITSAVELVTKTPSVCNRQGSRIMLVTEPTSISRVIAIQGGMSGYETPPALLVVSSDLESFIAPTERNQAFVDGGLLAMSLLLSLEYYTLAACPLNAMLSGKNEDSIKAILGLPESHRLIMFIAVGEFLDEVKVPKSFRLPAGDIFSTYRTVAAAEDA